MSQEAMPVDLRGARVRQFITEAADYLSGRFRLFQRKRHSCNSLNTISNADTMVAIAPISIIVIGKPPTLVSVGAYPSDEHHLITI